MASGFGPPLRLVFMGTGEFGRPAFEALVRSRHRILAVYTQPPRPAGRGLAPRPSAIGQAAERHGLEVRTPASLRDCEVQAQFAALEADLGVVAAYGLLLPKPILDAPGLGCINLHASLLPRWRGAAPIQHAILAGDQETGVTIFQMEPGLDTGAMLARERIGIAPDATAGRLHETLAALAGRMIVPLVDAIAAGGVHAAPQGAEGVTYAGKLDRGADRLDWTRSAAELERQIRAFDPWPGCWTEFSEQRLRVLAGEIAAHGHGAPPGTVLDERLTVACGDGALRITRVQRPGGRPLAAEDFLRGSPIPVGSRLGEPCPATS